MFFGLFFFLFLAGSLLVAIVALSVAIFRWRNKDLRIGGLGIATIAVLPFFWWLTHDPNNSSEAKSWRGTYEVHCLDAAVLVLSEDQTYKIISPSLPTSLNGTWSWINGEDFNYVELERSDGFVVQLFGNPNKAGTDHPLFGSEIRPCSFVRIPD
jgi:hypothetical protein